jgi:rsbT co-antagonist protein RsbR
MTHAAHRLLHRLFTERQRELIDTWRARLPQNELGDAGQLHTEMDNLLSALVSRFDVVDEASSEHCQRALDKVVADASQARALRGQSPESSVRFVQALKDAVLKMVVPALPKELDDRVQASDLLQTVMDRCVTTQVTQFVSARERVIRDQALSLLDMSTPVITLWDSILLLPLVGVVDSVRSVQIAERLLEAIGRTEAEVSIIDVTGVPVMDTSVARHLLRTVAAAEMLGTRVILTGISPDTAQTIVKLGIDMSSVPTRGTLKAGVALALQITGRQIGARNAAAGG